MQIYEFYAKHFDTKNGNFKKSVIVLILATTHNDNGCNSQMTLYNPTTYEEIKKCHQQKKEYVIHTALCI